jgi:hypothetical protein
MAVLYVYMTMGSWCHRCEQWMGWRGMKGFADYDNADGSHANCSPVDYSRPVRKMERKPRVWILEAPLPQPPLEDW